MKKKLLNIFILILGILIFVGGAIGYYFYSVMNTRFQLTNTVYIYVDESKDYPKLLKEIADSAKVSDISAFDRAAGWLSYKTNMKKGRYAIKPGMTVREVIGQLRSGSQTPVRLTFNNIRTKEDLVVRLSEQLMIDQNNLFSALENDQICNQFGFTNKTIVAMFIPNTYEVYWDVTIDALLKRMKREYDRFWNGSRKDKASVIGLTPIEVSILASIVEEECTFTDEYPTVAGLYLNRIKRKQLLQADPTVKFAVGDFTLRRILNVHLNIDSPYNTYKYAGLPPGPIRIPSIKGIDSVLNYRKHEYLYMCAKEDFSGRHNFAKTLSEHNRNAANYRFALNHSGIYK